MDIHPLFVHFPIGLLVIYAVLEILPLMRWYPQAPWDAIKTVLSILGAASAVLASGTGSIADDLLTDTAAKKIVEVHAPFAAITTLIFCVLAFSYFIRWVSRYHHLFEGRLSFVSFLGSIADFIAQRWIVVLLSLLGLMTLTITGALGAAIVYGPDADPLVAIIYSLFF